MILIIVFSVLKKFRIQSCPILHNIYIQKPMSHELSYNIWFLISKFINILHSSNDCYKYGSFSIMFVFLCFFICNYGSKRSRVVIIEWVCTLIIMVVCLQYNINTIFIE